jgi:hypothetical protein
VNYSRGIHLIGLNLSRHEHQLPVRLLPKGIGLRSVPPAPCGLIFTLGERQGDNAVHYQYTCGAENETVPGLCGRPVSGPGGLCCCHGPGSCGHRSGITFRSTEPPATPADRGNTDQPPRDGRRYAHKQVVPIAEATALVADIITEDWKSAIAEKEADVLNRAFWNSIPRRQRRRRANCRTLAELADFMESSLEEAHDAIGAIANWGLNWFGTPALERSIAVAFAKKIPLPGQDQIAAAVQSIRIYGVFLCAIEGLDIVARCPCFWKLAEDKSKEELEAVLEAKLDSLATTSRSFTFK